MDIQSIGSQPSTNLPISDSFSGTPIATQIFKSTAPQSSNPVTPVGQAQQTATREQINKAVESINKTIQTSAQGVEFSVDNDLKEVVVKVVDQETKQVLRQIPTVEVLEIAKSLDKLQGLLIKQTA
jgi:flagellar protein FlaG